MLEKKRILALTRYDQCAASTRQRFLQFAPALAEAGFDLRISSLFDDNDFKAVNLNRRGSALKLAGLYWHRLRTMLRRDKTDLLWIQYESFPFLPAAFERAAFFPGVPIVVDYDDAYFHRYDRHRSRLVRVALGGKLRPLISGADEIVAGNAYLANYARQWNKQVTIIPTVVDTDVYRPRLSSKHQPVTIGWIGSPTTWRAYVRPQLGLLRQICEQGQARFLVVGAGEVPAADRFHGMELRPWREANEVDDIQDMDIGIMPLPDDAWARGKCGYKLIQYMAGGLPTVASPVGVNADIVLAGQTGFLAKTADDWHRHIMRLVVDPPLRRRLGSAGRARAMRFYSLAAHAPALVDVMQRLLVRSR